MKLIVKHISIITYPIPVITILVILGVEDD